MIPEAAAEEIIGVFARRNARHTLYSAEENMEIDKVVPVAASVKTKLGRGGTGEE